MSTPAKEKNTKNTKNPENKENPTVRDLKTKTGKSFNLETEVGKLKIVVPLSELAKHDAYQSQINRSLKITGTKDSVNVFVDQPELIFGPEVNGKPLDVGIPPFCVSLNIYDKKLHNVVFNFGASHNLMPKYVMEKLDLDITRPYKDLFSFDSSQVRCLGLTKNLCVSLVQYPVKKNLMDIVVADICYFLDPRVLSFRDLFNWTCPMLLSWFSANLRSYTEKH